MKTFGTIGREQVEPTEKGLTSELSVSTMPTAGIKLRLPSSDSKHFYLLPSCSGRLVLFTVMNNKLNVLEEFFGICLFSCVL